MLGRSNSWLHCRVKAVAASVMASDRGSRFFLPRCSPVISGILEGGIIALMAAIPIAQSV